MPHKSYTIHISTEGMGKKKTLNKISGKFDGEVMFLSLRANRMIDLFTGIIYEGEFILNCNKIEKLYLEKSYNFFFVLLSKIPHFSF